MTPGSRQDHLRMHLNLEGTLDDSEERQDVSQGRVPDCDSIRRRLLAKHRCKLMESWVLATGTKQPKAKRLRRLSTDGQYLSQHR